MTARLLRNTRTALTLTLAIGCTTDRADETRAPTIPTSIALVAQPSDSAGTTAQAIVLQDEAKLTVASFRVGVHYDSANVKFAGASGEDASIVYNDVGGRVLVAGASATGYQSGTLIVLRFAPRRAGATAPQATPAIELMDLGDVNAKDIRARVTLTPEWKPVR